jgi:hypothetical protein
MKIILEYNRFSHKEELMNKIRVVLTPDLLKGMWKNANLSNGVAGHCYAATEALYWMLGGPDGEYKAFVLSHRVWPEGLNNGETHWFLRNSGGDILDPTADQFDVDILYDRGVPNGMMNYPNGGSKRAREIIKRVNAL